MLVHTRALLRDLLQSALPLPPVALPQHRRRHGRTGEECDECVFYVVERLSPTQTDGDTRIESSRALLAG